MQAGGGMGGYGYTFSDGTSIACLDGNTFCGDGTIAMADSAFTLYGGGIGVNLNQAAGTTTPGMYTPTGKSGIAYALTNLPQSPATVRIIIDNGGVDNCAPISTASGMVTWAQFTPRCYNLPGGDAGAPLGGPPSATHVQFQVNSSATGPGAFNFCVTSLQFM